jgi:hypothetical protein
MSNPADAARRTLQLGGNSGEIPGEDAASRHTRLAHTRGHRPELAPPPAEECAVGVVLGAGPPRRMTYGVSPGMT